MEEIKELEQAVTHGYGLSRVKMTVIDQKDEVYKVECKQGAFALKKNKYPNDEFLFIYYGMEHLVQNNYKDLNRVILTKNASPLLEACGKPYFLSKWLSGRPANYTKLKEAEQVGAALAKLHLAGFGYQPFYYEGRIKWGQNLEIIKNKEADLKRYLEIGTGNPKPDFFDLLYKKNVEGYLKCFQTAYKTMKPVFQAVDSSAFRMGSFCHHDLAAHNLVLRGKKVSFIDFDYAICDTHCHDLASFLLRVLKANDYETSLAQKACRAYEKQLPLNQAEKQMVLAFMQIPQNFWQLGLAYYDEEKFMLPENREQNKPRLMKLESRLNSTLTKRLKREKAISRLADHWGI